MKRKHTRTAGGLVVNPACRVLLVFKHDGSGSFPKGGIEEGEDTLTAAKREIFEETGVADLTFVEEFKPYKRYKCGPNGSDDRSEWKRITMLLLVTNQLTPPEPRDSKHPVAIWAKLDQVDDYLTHPKDKKFWRNIRRKLRQ